MKFKDFIFSDEVLMRGTFKAPSGFSKLNFEHFIEMISYDLINNKERKIVFQFRLIMRPDVGEINFVGECILESPQQDKIDFIINFLPGALRSLTDKIILKESYFHAEKFAKQEEFLFPSVHVILKGLRIK